MLNKLNIALDVDDVLMHCNQYALDKLNKEKGTLYSLYDIKRWGMMNNGLDERMKYFNDPEFVKSQVPIEGSIEFVNKLKEMGNIYIITSVPSNCIGERIKSVMDIYNIPIQNIIVGRQKSLINIDVLLDDGIHNILESNAKYPVLFRQPWNYDATGLLTVSNYGEFITLIELITSNKYDPKLEAKPKVVSLVGPSGSNKNKIVTELLKTGKYEKVKTYTTNPSHAPLNYNQVSEGEFLNMKNEFFETSYYAGYHYGTLKEDIDKVLQSEMNAIMVLDVNGAIAMKKTYQAQSVNCFIEVEKSDIIHNLIDDYELGVFSREELEKRLLSINQEIKNRQLCDIIATPENIMNRLQEVV